MQILTWFGNAIRDLYAKHNALTATGIIAGLVVLALIVVLALWWSGLLEWVSALGVFGG